MTVGQIDKDDLQAHLKEAIARHQVPGMSVAILRNGEEMITAAAGVANINTGVALTEDTVMHIGSITKVFNATLMMQLVDQGKVDLDERVVRYLPELKLKDPAALEQITVKMLLNHTSGIDGSWLSDRGHDDETLEKTVARAADLAQLFLPGTEYSYNNVAAVIAGYLAQRVTGKSWYRLIKEQIFEPLGMNHAAALPEEALLHRASVGHFLDPKSPDRWIRTSHAFLGLGFAPAGSTLMMSPSDLITFARAHLAQGEEAQGSRILSANSAKAMQQMSVNNIGKGYGPNGVGLGWMLSKDGFQGHMGGGPGVYACLCVHPARRFVIACMTNAAEPGSMITLHELVYRWFNGHGLSSPFWWESEGIPAETVHVHQDRYVGVYEDAVFRWTVMAMGDGLALSTQHKVTNYDNETKERSPPVRLIPIGGDRFLRDATDEFYARFPPARRVAFRGLDGAGRPRLLAVASSLGVRCSA